MKPIADFILFNANVYTGNPKQPKAQALAAWQGRIIAIGDNAMIQSLANQETVSYDAKGAMAMPGFIDNHTHLRWGGETLLSVDLRDAKNREEFVTRIAGHVATLPTGTWITGGSWDNEAWDNSALPRRDWIDACTPDHPVLVYRLDLHMGVANSLALRLAGIDRNTPNPDGGTIERDSDGEATGIVKDAAMALIWKAMPELKTEDIIRQLTAAMLHANSLGVTSVQDVTSWEEWLALLEMKRRNVLTLRVSARTPIPEWEKQSDWVEKHGKGDEWLKLAGVKGFSDGSLGSTTACFFEHYADEPDNCGLLHDQMFPEGIMQERITAADAARLQCSIHAIGDRANHIILDLFETAERVNGRRDSRHRVEHAQHLLPSDLKRFSELGIVASVQPYHAIDDARFAERRIGKLRCQTTYPFRSLIEAGAVVSFGTDWPVAPLNPLLGVYGAVTRTTLEGHFPDGWIPKEKISVVEAIRAYTETSAWVEFGEKEKGTLEIGKLADIVILSDDIHVIPLHDIRDIKVLATIVGGTIVYQA